VSRDSRADIRTDPPSHTPEPRADSGPATRLPRLPMDGLSLPRTDMRERVTVDDRVYHLRGSETRTLATVGAFRLVPAAQLDEPRGDYWSGDLQRLDAQGLIERKTITVNHQPMRLVVLTREGQALLAAKQDQDAAGRASSTTRDWSSRARPPTTPSCIGSFKPKAHGLRRAAVGLSGSSSTTS